MNAFINKLSPAQVSKQNALLLDVRTPLEFGEAHIEGSVLHPLGELDVEAVRELASGKESCVVICRSGNRAGQAAQKLAAAGMDNLSVLEGGIQAWETAGHALNRGEKVVSLERQVRIAAGALVLSGVLLGFFVNSGFFLLSGFVGAGLIFAGITDWCGMGLLIARMPWNTRRPGTSCCSSKS